MILRRAARLLRPTLPFALGPRSGRSDESPFAKQAVSRTAWLASGCLLASVTVGSAGCRAGEVSPTPEKKAKTEKAEPATGKKAHKEAKRPRKPPKGAARVPVEPIPAPADVAAPPATAEKTASGLVSAVITPGTGKTHPKPADQVKVHYTGWTKDGKMFDSSVSRGQPSQFGLTRVIKGWTEGLQLMVEGEKRRLWIPAGLAYGEKPRRPGAPSGQLTFDVELIEIVAPPPVPENVAAPPPTAKKTASGLSYLVLKAGDGGKKPTEKDRVRVHYSGWTKDGKMFDSSVARGRPASFRVTGVIKGWTEGLQLMTVGEKTRFWIPAGLAYGDKPQRPGSPSGQLTFDVELLEIR